jgi:hypothetical protein
MSKFVRAAVFAARVAAASAVAATVARAADVSPSLQSFGASRAISAYELSANGFAIEPAVLASLDHSGQRLADIAYGMPLSSSSLMSNNLSLDLGRGLDVGSRFTDYAAAQQPFLTAVNAPFLDLANGGRYGGVTFLAGPNLRLRAGASINSERLDNFHFDAAQPIGNLALTYDASQTRALLGGVSWDATNALGLDFTAISADRSGVPLGVANAAVIAPKASTNAMGMSAHLNIGQGWVTTASFSEGLTQLDQRGGLGTSLREQSYGFAVAKHGLFGDDTLGLSLSRPAPSMAGGFASLTGSGDALPPLVLSQAGGLTGARAPETDIQVGYVTNFLNGAVALQTNAAFQTNYQGQPGATSVALLSRAKIKF